ncbi:MAG TPA: hypothetical protein PLO45_05840 [Defluviitoga sp.]|nr:hypothetical protein [Defluviitoga sp.]
MNIFDLVTNFFEEDKKSKISSSAAKLYFFLIYQANKAYWEGPLTFSVRQLAILLSASKNTVAKSLKELHERELITYYPPECIQDTSPKSIWFPQPTSKSTTTGNLLHKKEVKSYVKHPKIKDNRYINFF